MKEHYLCCNQSRNERFGIVLCLFFSATALEESQIKSEETNRPGRSTINAHWHDDQLLKILSADWTNILLIKKSNMPLYIWCFIMNCTEQKYLISTRQRCIGFVLLQLWIRPLKCMCNGCIKGEINPRFDAVTRRRGSWV